MAVGAVGFWQGKVGLFNGRWQLAHPVFEPLDEQGTSKGLDEEESLEHLPDLRPVYPLTASVAHSDLTRTVAFALDLLDPVPDPLPERLREELGLVSHDQALRWIHRPTTGLSNAPPASDSPSTRRS